MLYLLGAFTSYTLSGLIHVLLAVALFMVLIRVIQEHRIVWGFGGTEALASRHSRSADRPGWRLSRGTGSS